MTRRLLCAAFGILPISSVYAQPRPVVDHHQHLPSPAAVTLVNQARRPGVPRFERKTAKQLVAQLDEAGIQRAVVLSTAYWFASAVLPKAAGDEWTNVRAENDWTAREAARFPNRLIAFCSVNPLRDYALAELERCAGDPSLKGLKLHFANSGVDVLNATHVETLRRFFTTANELRLPIVAHLWTPRSYGREHAKAFLTQVVPMAPDIPIQITHFAGGGPGYTDPALAVYAEAIAAAEPTTKNLYFDLATVANDQPTDVLRKLAARIRQVGLQRVLFGTDAGSSVRQAWATFRTTVPLHKNELATIARNVAPYLP
jgi:predicted TIM-barrel fold metal-dependent hydrolase